MSSCTLFSPAKLNLFFRVMGKREDGFHEIASLYQAISWGDELMLSLAERDCFTCSDPNLSLGKENLVLRALSLFREKTGRTSPVRIHLEKRIPMESGLGGGSSNGATTLWGLRYLLGGCEEGELQQWSLALGSDLPFFFSKGTAYCTGRGGHVQEVAGREGSVWVAKPSFGLSTSLVYQHVRVGEGKDPLHLLEQVLQGSWELGNDLEEAAVELDPRVRGMRKELLAMGFSSVYMTGSGSSFFCLGEPSSEGNSSFVLQKVQFLTRKEGQWYKLDFATF